MAFCPLKLTCLAFKIRRQYMPMTTQQLIDQLIKIKYLVTAGFLGEGSLLPHWLKTLDEENQKKAVDLIRSFDQRFQKLFDVVMKSLWRCPNIKNDFFKAMMGYDLPDAKPPLKHVDTGRPEPALVIYKTEAEVKTYGLMLDPGRQMAALSNIRIFLLKDAYIPI